MRRKEAKPVFEMSGVGQVVAIGVGFAMIAVMFVMVAVVAGVTGEYW